METLSQLSLELTRWLQDNLGSVEILFDITTELIQIRIFLVILTAIYWTFDKRLGRILTYLIAFSGALSEITKHLFRDPRPYWQNPEIGLLAEENYGIPSGHAQHSTVLFGLLALWYQKTALWLFALALIVITALGRLYFGVHDLQDVIAGFLVGIFILLLYLAWQRSLNVWFSNRILGQRILIAIIVPILLSILYVIALLVIGKPDLNVTWKSYVELAETESMQNVASGLASLLGFTIGFLMESSRVRFVVRGTIWQRLLRYLLGITIVFALYIGLGFLIPEEPPLINLPLKILQALLTTLWISLYAPMVFVRLRLADAEPKPETAIRL